MSSRSGKCRGRDEPGLSGTEGGSSGRGGQAGWGALHCMRLSAHNLASPQAETTVPQELHQAQSLGVPDHLQVTKLGQPPSHRKPSRLPAKTPGGKVPRRLTR